MNMTVETQYCGKIDSDIYKAVAELTQKLIKENIKLKRLNIPIKVTVSLQNLDNYKPNERRFYSSEVGTIVQTEQLNAHDLQYNTENNIIGEQYTESELRIRHQVLNASL